jgi:protein O-GlcNAc transferase
MPVEDPASPWTNAIEHHLAGRLGDAEFAYRQILAAEPRHAGALHMLGVLHFQLGHGQAGLELIDRAIVSDDRVPAYHSHRGLVLASLERQEEAIASYRRALDIQPGQAETLNNLGNALRTQGDLPGALASYRQAFAAQPDQAETAINLGWALLNTEAFEEAAAVLESALALHPGDGRISEQLTIACNNLGAALLRQDEAQRALDLFFKALTLRPEFFEAHFNAGKALAQLSRHDEAVARYQHAISLAPARAEAHNDLGIALCQRGRIDEAIASYREALRLQPDYAQAYNNLGNALRVRGSLAESVAAYGQALRFAPDDAEVWNNLGSVQAAMGDLEAATRAFERALQIRPDLNEAHNNLGNACKDQGDVEAALDCYARAVAIRPSDEEAQSNRLYTLYFHPRLSLQEIYREHADWNARHAAGLCPPNQAFGNDRSPGRRLRIGYVAPFFREHCQSLFMVPLLSHHDHRQFEVFAYSDVTTPDAVTARLHGYCDHWRNIAGLSDEAAAELIRQDQIDILIDLSLHMAGNRMLLFARKPAPVQATWLGYPGTTGLQTIDYRLTDPYLDPPTAENDAWYSERSHRLPNTFWCYDPLTTEIPVNDLPVGRHGYVTFGCLNNFCKVNADTLRLWAGALRATPHSRLLLLALGGPARSRTLDVLQNNGVDPSRVEFVDRQSRARYLALYHRIDVGLDTIPYNGHTTTLDSLWMGVPVVTLVGDAPAGRAGWSQLCNLGLPHLAADSEEQFAQIAAQLCADTAALARLRAELRSRFFQSPLGDAPRFARDIETAYRQMWKNFCHPGH